MTNVTALFPQKEPQILSRAIQEMADWYKDKNVPSILTDLILQMSNETMRGIMPNHVLERVGYLFSTKEDSSDFRIAFYTKVREELVPEFGTQGHTDFVNIFAISVKDKPDPVAFPDNLYQGLLDYFSKYPDQPSNHIGFCYALTKAILEDNRFRYVPLELDDDVDQFKDRYVFAVTEDSEDCNFLYVFAFDFLPIILDNVALAFYDRKLKPE